MKAKVRYFTSIIILIGSIFLQFEYEEITWIQYIIPVYTSIMLIAFLFSQLNKINLREKRVEIESDVLEGNTKREKAIGTIEDIRFEYVKKRNDGLTSSHYRVYIDIAINHNNSMVYHQISKNIYNLPEEVTYELSKIDFGFEKNLDANTILKNYFKNDFYEGKNVSMYLDPNNKEEPILADNILSSIIKENSKIDKIPFFVFMIFLCFIAITYVMVKLLK